MKKICLFTIYVENYGAVLQTYALSTYLRSLKQVERVDIANIYSANVYQLLRKIKSRNPLFTLIKRVMLLPYRHLIKKRYCKEKRFMHATCTYTSRYSSLTDFEHAKKDYDIYLTGSDQVFNLNSTYADFFFQNFHSNKKYAYASSLGTTTFPIEKTEKAISLLSSFQRISIREQASADYLTQLLSKEVECVVDPVLLLTADQWSSIAIEPKDDHYLLVYDLNGGKPLIEHAKILAQKFNLQIICICPKLKQKHSGVKMVYDAGPQEFVGYFKRANFVLTDSFHGTMFSLIFQKDFYTYIAVEKTSGRITSILKRGGLDNRIIPKSTKTVEYSRIQHFDEDQLNVLIQHSKQFLAMVVND